MDRVSRVRKVCATWGTKDTVVSAAAAKPMLSTHRVTATDSLLV
jgi:hypothetical protein